MPENRPKCKSEKCANHNVIMRRFYVRRRKKLLAMGWICLNCYNLKLDIPEETIKELSII